MIRVEVRFDLHDCVYVAKQEDLNKLEKLFKEGWVVISHQVIQAYNFHNTTIRPKEIYILKERN